MVALSSYTFYSETSAGHLGCGDFGRIQRLCYFLDDLISRTSKFAGKKWHETLDYSGQVRQVRPQRSDRLKKHYKFDELGNYIGKW
jgi:hypothetical protein